MSWLTLSILEVNERIRANAEAAYRYGVTGYDRFEDCPKFTNLVRTEFGAKLVQRRFETQGLKTKIYDLTVEQAPGLNPYKEKHL